MTSGRWFCTLLWKAFQVATLQNGLAFWARVGSGRIRLSRTFRGPFANLSRISRLKTKSETNVYARVVFIIYANQGATANLRIWDNTKLKPVRIHRQIKSRCLRYITQYLSVCCIDAIYSPKQGSCGNSARKLPSMNTMFITCHIYIVCL